MSRKGKSRAMKQEVINLKNRGLPLRKIAEGLGISRNTVRVILRAQQAAEGAGAAPGPSFEAARPWLAQIDVEEVCRKRKGGRTLLALYEAYEPAASYTSFRRAINALCKEHKATTLRLIHKPGEKAFVDYCDGISIVDRATGATKKTQLFCGVLPFSSLTFGEFTFDQTLPSFIASHEAMWRYFGGVTLYVVLDNLKSGVHKAHLYDPDINPTYCEYAGKRGFAVLPARPQTPRDKAAVEAGIGVIQRTFYQKVADRVFYSIGELNHAFREFLDGLNSSVMRDYGVSRRDRFAEESALLLPFDGEVYEISTWKEVKVHPDGHVQILKNLYSVPYQYKGQKLRARIRNQMIDLFTSCGTPVWTHKRLHGIGGVETKDEHYPEPQLHTQIFEVKYTIDQARLIGPKTEALVTHLFDDERPLRRLRLAQGIVRLVKERFTKEALEAACEKALSFNEYRLKFITQCAQFNSRSSQKTKSRTAPVRDESTLHLHNKGPHNVDR